METIKEKRKKWEYKSKSSKRKKNLQTKRRKKMCYGALSFL